MSQSKRKSKYTQMMSYLLLVLVGLLLGEDCLAKKDFLIVANGEWNEDIVREYMPNRTVIALDGAAIHFHTCSLVPHYILGDLDSIAEEKKCTGINYFNFTSAFGYYKNLSIPDDAIVKFEEYKTKAKLNNNKKVNIVYVRTMSQNYTDLDKGIQFCLHQRQSGEPIDITVVCACGGNRIDHFLGNFSVLKKYNIPNVKIRFVNDLQIVEFLRNERVVFTGPIGAKFGLLGFPQALATSKGLKWELSHDYPLEIGKRGSSCNELKNTEVIIEVKGEALMIRPATSVRIKL